MRTHYRSYDPNGQLAEETWTSSCVTELVERAAFQSRLNRGDLSRVEIWKPVPFSEIETLYPEEKNDSK